MPVLFLWAHAVKCCINIIVHVIIIFFFTLTLYRVQMLTLLTEAFPSKGSGKFQVHTLKKTVMNYLRNAVLQSCHANTGLIRAGKILESVE
jgi:hypothetical protein